MSDLRKEALAFGLAATDHALIYGNETAARHMARLAARKALAHVRVLEGKKEKG